MLWKFKRNISDLLRVEIFAHPPFYLEMDSYLLTIFLMVLEVSFVCHFESRWGINNKERK